MRRHRVTLSLDALTEAAWLVKNQRIEQEVIANMQRGDERQRLRAHVRAIERIERELNEALDLALAQAKDRDSR